MNWWDKPLADKGLFSYRYKGPYGFIMIGANSTHEALKEANRSLTYGRAIITNLEMWNEEKQVYVKC